MCTFGLLATLQNLLTCHHTRVGLMNKPTNDHYQGRARDPTILSESSLNLLEPSISNRISKLIKRCTNFTPEIKTKLLGGGDDAM